MRNSLLMKSISCNVSCLISFCLRFVSSPEYLAKINCYKKVFIIIQCTCYIIDDGTGQPEICGDFVIEVAVKITFFSFSIHFLKHDL